VPALTAPYNDRYFGRYISGSSASAEAILPQVLDLVQPATAIDVGCGVGQWTRVLLDRGVDALGVDGYATVGSLAIPSDRFIRRDLTRGTGVERRFDLAISLEVIEHLPVEAGDGFVAELARLAPVVLFAAAVPYQGGTDHVNERPAGHWAQRFASHGLTPFDVIRPRVWTHPGVEPWYKQNCLLYVHESHEERLGLTDEDRPQLLDVIHPEILAWKVGHPPLRDVAKMLPGAVRRGVQRRLPKRPAR
jgi:SAM-dependent methyltransferase